jgi:hypothetical protein
MIGQVLETEGTVQFVQLDATVVVDEGVGGLG